MNCFFTDDKYSVPQLMISSVTLMFVSIVNNSLVSYQREGRTSPQELT